MSLEPLLGAGRPSLRSRLTSWFLLAVVLGFVLALNVCGCAVPR